jgi:CheY-like chemotaxis protein
LDVLIRVYGGQRQDIAEPSRPVIVTRVDNPMRILLAEDNKINQTFAVAFLKKAGHEVEIAENGHQAVAAVKRADYDLVLMDIQMPELDGIGATKEIRGLESPKSAIPIIAMTANAMTGARQEYLDAGMNDYISKPVQADVLLAKLAQIAVTLPARRKEAPAATSEAERQTAAAQQLPVFETQAVASLLSVLDLPELRALLLAYVRDTGSQIGAIMEMSLANDFSGTAREAHMIVSTAGNIGAEQVSHLARALEHACRERDGASVRLLVEELNMASIAASEAVRTWLMKPAVEDAA